jgi:diphthamide biosynthesis protein 2
VDEVAAEHYCADAIVHFGHACLSPTPGKVAVRYEFGKQPVNTDKCISEVLPVFAGDWTRSVLLLYDTIYYHAICNGVAPALQQKLPNMFVPSLVLPDDAVEAIPKNGLKIQFGRNFDLPQGNSISDYTVLYIGDHTSPFLGAFLMNFPGCRCISYDPQTEKAVADAWNSNRALAKRYYLVECARDAKRVGILVGTLGVADYLSIVTRLEKILRRAGKAVYRFVVGKINTAKLANFADIDVFVLIACSENSLVDSKEFYRPIVTPFEMEMACCPGRQWTGNYEVDFRQLLPGGMSHHETGNEDSFEEQSDMSLVTGKVRHIGVDDQGAQCGSSALVNRNEQITVANNTASEFFSERSWRGLEPQLGKTPIQLAVEGSKGIAMNYSHEPIMASVDNTKQ